MRSEGRRAFAQDSTAAWARAAAEAEAARPRSHVIQNGEALASIARLYDTTPEELQRLNQLPDTRIRVGDRIRVGPK
ncbi:MAG: LysM peptidoglycan-binding domain-containing protein [Gemmatimonadaceae bacterium]|nr:LysM peptidoglycan-binding domain-containing protein [Gemmatimonadaceae bacterium]